MAHNQPARLSARQSESMRRATSARVLANYDLIRLCGHANCPHPTQYGRRSLVGRDAAVELCDSGELDSGGCGVGIDGRTAGADSVRHAGRPGGDDGRDVYCAERLSDRRSLPPPRNPGGHGRASSDALAGGIVAARGRGCDRRCRRCLAGGCTRRAVGVLAACLSGSPRRRRSRDRCPSETSFAASVMSL